MAVVIEVSDNGPYVIRGEDTKVFDADGTELRWGGRGIALCRCGGSSNKPFCDGTHGQIGFESTPRASS